MFTITIFLLISAWGEFAYSQDSDNYYTVCNNWNTFYNANPDLKLSEGGGYTKFIRWQEFWRSRVMSGNPADNGSFSLYGNAMKHYYENKEYFTRSTNIFSDWQFLGPKTSAIQNIGQVSAVYVDTVSDKSMNTIYIGTNSSGIWRTMDGGHNWHNLTDGSSFYINGITDIVGDPNNANIIYAATGGGFMGDHGYSSGIIKTINSGQTWDQFYPIANSTKQSVNEILIDPANTNHIFALIDTAVLRTIDGGSHWWPILKIPRIGAPINEEKRYCTNIVMKPGDANIIYVATSNWHWANSHSQEIWKISNALHSDTNLILKERLDINLPNNGHPIHTERFKLAVTHVNPNALFVACNEVSDTIERLKIWKYTNNVWTTEIDTTNCSNGVGFFKFEFLISPTDQNVIYIGGLTMQRFVKIGNFWQRLDYTEGVQGDTTYHFDTRDAKILKGSTVGNSGQGDILFAGNDGGLSKTINGIHTWTNLNGNGLSITQFYGIGSANVIPQTIAGGSQDNSYFKYENGVWTDHEYGDWGNILVDYNSPLIMYGNIWGGGVGGIMKSTDGGNTWAGVPVDTVRSEHRFPNTPLALNPKNPKTIFFGAENLYKSYNRLDINAPLIKIQIPQAECDTCPKNAIGAFCIAPTDTSRIYVVISGITWEQPKKFFRSKDNGLTWKNLTDSVKINQVGIFGNYFVSDIVVSPTDRETIWMTLSGFWSPWGDNSRVIVSHNGGASFINCSIGLPNMPVNCIRYLNGSNDGLLVGTDVGVYYIDNSLTEWQPFNTALPTCPVTDLEINDNTKKVRAGTFGRGLWETSLDCNFSANTPLLIHQNKTWLNDTVLNNSIYIDSSYTLTIKCRVLFPPMAKIFVKQGAKLIVDGGVLTNKCINYWQGIEVWGRYDKPQNTYYQGMVSMKNGAILENSRIGITTCKKDQNGYFEWTTTGGIIKGENCTFRNNYKAAEFVMNLRGQSSSFKRVTFETTPDFLTGATPGDFAYVSLLGVKGVQFLGCTFRNLATPANAIPRSDAGTGIYSLGSSFQVDNYEYCPTTIVPCPNPRISPSVFQGLRYGIRALGFDPTYNFSVKNTRFENNFRGAFFSSINNLVITRDTFKLTTIETNQDTLYGLFLDKSSGYKIQENRFSCNGNNLMTNPNVHLLQREFGIVIDSSGSAPNEIYKNYFEHLDVAINAQKQNKHLMDSTGLVLKCNIYNENSYDEIFTGTLMNNHEGVAAKQGAKTIDMKDPAGNTFSPYHAQYSNTGSMDKLDIKNKVDPIKYFHHIQAIGPNEPRVEPTLISDNKVTNVNTNWPYSTTICCPSKLNSGGGNTDLDELKQQLLVEQFKVDSLTTVLSQLVDGGNTDALNTDILFSTSQQALDLHQELLEKSPYLSDTVMKSALDKETVLPNEMIRDIMVANPQFSQSENVLDKLNERFIPMPENMMDEILANADSLSPKDKVEAELQANILKRQITFNELVRYYQNDTLNPASTDSLLVLLEKEPNVEGQYLRAFEYLSLSNLNLLNLVLEQIPQRFTLNDVQLQQYEDYIAYFSFLVNQNNNNRNYFELNDDEVTQLQMLGSEALEPVKTYSRNILEANSKLFNNEIILIPDNTKSVPKTEHIKSGKLSNERYINIFPNPSRQFIIVDYNAKGAIKEGERLIFTVSTIEGKSIESEIVTKPQDQFMIETASFKPGIYVCSMSIGNRNIGSTKFTIIH